MKKIFLIDDSATILMSMTSILKQAGYTVETAKDGQDGFEKLKSMAVKPNLIITDVNMPRMNGLELIKAVKTQLSGYRFVPILVLTTESHQSRRQEAKSAGAAGWLVKPVAGSDLLKVIKELVPGA